MCQKSPEFRQDLVNNSYSASGGTQAGYNAASVPPTTEKDLA